MENAADALKMAADVLLFGLAISIAILSFRQVREASDIILDYRDRETVYIDSGYYYETTGTERSVGLDSIIPAISKAYLENYKIVFEGLDNPIYTINLNVRLQDGTTKIDKYSLDLETNQDSIYSNVVLANNEQKSEFLCGILYGGFKNNDRNAFEKKFNITLPPTNLYNQLKNKLEKGFVIKEYLGVYYQDDSENIPDVNKTEKRIITYSIERK